MRRFPRLAAPVSGFIIALAGCASAPVEPGSETAATVGEPVAGEQRAASAATVEPPSGKSLEPAREKTVRETMSDRLRPAAAATRENRSEDNPSTAKLVAQLNDATRELATLRVANARLRGERAPSAATVRADPVDEKLAASLRSHPQFKHELSGLMAEMEKARTENASMSAALKDASTKSKEASTALAPIEDELRREKASRMQAEQTAGRLREQLRIIASALSDAGLNFDTFSVGAEPAARLETSESRLQPGSRASTGSKHTVREGETLERIAERYYGDSSKWRIILDANRGRLRLDGTLEPGMELEIPRR